MQTAAQYREYARLCEILMDRAATPKRADMLRRESQDWLALARQRKLRLRNAPAAMTIAEDCAKVLADLGVDPAFYAGYESRQ